MQWYVIAAAAVLGAAVLLYIRRNTAEQATIHDLSDRLEAMRRGELAYPFFGFHTRNTDAMYFAYEGGSYWFEYELADDTRVKYVEPIKDLSAELGLSWEDGKYDDVPIIRVKLSSSSESAAESIFTFAEKLFGITKSTVVEFVP